MKQNPTIEETLEFVKDAHENHLIKPSRSIIPYHWHLLRVMLRLGDTATHEEKLVALLHDVLEDTTITKEDLKQRGYSDRVISDVVYCSFTEYPKLSKQKWMKLIHEEAPASVIKVKYADISDNLGFERMVGLYEILKAEMVEINKEQTTRSKSFFRQTEGFPILERIFTQILGKKPYNTEPGVFPIYYDSLNYLLNSNNSNREHEVKNILSLEFSDRKLIKKLLSYLTPEEQLSYMSLQNLTSWTMKGHLSLIKDNGQNDYVALRVSSDYANELQNYLIVNNLDNYAHNQIIRDKGTFHVTVLNAAEYGNIVKNQPEKIDIVNKYLNQDFDLFFHGIGKVEGFHKKTNENNTAYFAVLESPAIDTFREQLEFKQHDLHLTLGFENKDVHGIRKNRKTIVELPENIHKLYCLTKYPHLVKQSFKI